MNLLLIRRLVKFGTCIWCFWKRILFLTDQFGQFRQLAYKSLTNGRVKIISETIPWNIEGFAISKDRKRAAFTANEGGFSVLYLMDARSFKFKKVEMESKGLIGGIKFSDNGKKLGLSLNNAKSLPKHIVNLGKRNLDYLDVVQWTESEVGGLNTDEFVLPNLISFKSFDNLEVPAFIYKPEDIKEPVPVLLQFMADLRVNIDQDFLVRFSNG